MKVNSFGKSERLCSRKLIEELFISGNSFLCFPLKVTWQKAELPTPELAQVAFSVPKRLFKRAHDRNRIKRQIREAYRLRKNQLYEILEINNQIIALMVVFIGKEELEYCRIEKAMDKVIDKLRQEVGTKK